MIISTLASKLIFSGNKRQKRPSTIMSPRTVIPRPSICIPQQDEIDEVEEDIETPMEILLKKIRLLHSLDQADIELINKMSRDDILNLLHEFNNALIFKNGMKMIR